MAGMFSKHSDSFYYEVACRADEIIFEKTVGEMPTRDELKRLYSFSPEFESKMKVLLNRIDQRRIVPMPVKRILIIAAIVAALIVGALSASAIYKAVYNLYLSCMGKYSVATYSENSNLNADSIENIEVYYEPSTLPEGYIENRRSNSGVELRIYYNNGENEVVFTQCNIVNFKHIDSEKTEEVYISVYDWSGYFISKNDYINLIWEKDGYVFSLEGCIPLEEAIYVARNIKEIS